MTPRLSAAPPTATRDRPTRQTRIVAHFDRGVEAIAIDMDDLAGTGLTHGTATGME